MHTSEPILHYSQVRFYNDHPLPSWFFHKRNMFIPLFSYILTPLLLELSLQTKKIRHGKRIGGELLDGVGQTSHGIQDSGSFHFSLKIMKNLNIHSRPTVYLRESKCMFYLLPVILNISILLELLWIKIKSKSYKFGKLLEFRMLSKNIELIKFIPS
jgi:hypothetical protein